MSIVQIMETLGNTSGTNAKIDIIRENAENSVFMKVLDATLNPYYTYHIKQIPKVEEHSGTENINTFMSFLHLFKEREVTGHEARDVLQKLLTELTPEEADIAIRIIRKDLGVGVAASTVNKATGEMTIPIYPCLKATGYSEKAFAKIVYPAWSQIKADGMRANLIMNKDNVLRSRSGKFIDLHGLFDDVGAPFVQASMFGAVLDGELRLLNDDGTWMDRKKGNGLLNKAIRGSVTDDIISRVRFIAWDLIPGSEFNAFGNVAVDNPILYDDRWESLERFIDEANNPLLILSENVVVNSYEEALVHYRDARRRKEEGTIVKNIGHVWTGKKSQHLVKLKSVKDCDLQIIGWNPGKVGGKWEHGLGSLICASRDHKVIVSVSGLSDELRMELFENFDIYVGRIVAVEYNERIKDKTREDVDSLFSPRFLELREDKDEADESGDIK